MLASQKLKKQLFSTNIDLLKKANMINIERVAIHGGPGLNPNKDLEPSPTIQVKSNNVIFHQSSSRSMLVFNIIKEKNKISDMSCDSNWARKGP